MSTPTGPPPLVFRNLGGIYQLLVDDAETLGRLSELDAARWAVTSAPVPDLQCDPTFLAALDAKGNGRIRVSQVLAARDWLFKFLVGREHLASGSETLILADLDTRHADGQMLRRTADRVLDHTGASQRDTVSLTQVRGYKSGYFKSATNGDGLVCPSTVSDPELATFIKDIMAIIGGAPDLCGALGAGTPQLETYLRQGAAFRIWEARAKTPEGQLVPELFPWGAETAAAAAQLRALDGKLEQYFWQCDLLRQEPAAAARLKLTEEVLKQLNTSDPAAIRQQLAELPLAPPNPDGQLHLEALLNPFYSEALLALRDTVLRRALGEGGQALTRHEWQQVKAIFAAYWAWLAQRPPEPFEKVPPERLHAQLSGSLPEQLRQAIAADLAVAPEIAAVGLLERLLLYHRWLLPFVNNFVSLTALYDPDQRALFEMGSLVIDGRRLDFTLRVVDRASHKKIATESRIFLIYATISEQDGKPLLEVAAPVTRGERGRLIVGKRGVFFGVDGRVLDAQIVDVVENPISVWEAVKAPFRRIRNFVSTKVEEFAASKAKAAEESALKGLTAAGTAPPVPGAVALPGAPAKVPSSPGQMVGMLAGGGLAVAAISSAFAYVVSVVSRKGFLLDLLVAISSVVALIAFFAALLGWLRLRLRDLGPVLEANGWAVNLRMRVSGPLAKRFTRIPALPGNRKLLRFDGFRALLPDEEEIGKRRRTIYSVLLLVVLAAGYFTHRYLSEPDPDSPEAHLIHPALQRPPAARPPAPAAAPAPATP